MARQRRFIAGSTRISYMEPEDYFHPHPPLEAARASHTPWWPWRARWRWETGEGFAGPAQPVQRQRCPAGMCWQAWTIIGLFVLSTAAGYLIRSLPNP